MSLIDSFSSRQVTARRSAPKARVHQRDVKRMTNQICSIKNRAWAISRQPNIENKSASLKNIRGSLIAALLEVKALRDMIKNSSYQHAPRKDQKLELLQTRAETWLFQKPDYEPEPDYDLVAPSRQSKSVRFAEQTTIIGESDPRTSQVPSGKAERDTATTVDTRAAPPVNQTSRSESELLSAILSARDNLKKLDGTQTQEKNDGLSRARA